MPAWRFVHVTDLHLGSPRSFRYRPACNENWLTARRQILALRPDFLLAGGDLTRDGNLHLFELEAAKAELDSLPFPYHVVPGNMDTGNKHTDVSGARREGREDDLALNLTSGQVNRFAALFGPPWWSFVHAGVRVSGFCDMLAGSGLPEETELWRWLDAQRALPREKHHVWLTHYPLFIDEPREPNFDLQNPDQYRNWYFGMDEPARGRILDVFKATGAGIAISGHIHCRKHQQADGIRFDKAPSTGFGQWGQRWPDGDTTLGFLCYEVNESGIACRFVPLDRVSTAPENGPSGHVPTDRRLYPSAERAWVQPR